MSHRIYYFSGTGNSLWVARKMKESFPEAELIPITNDLPIELETTGVQIAGSDDQEGLVAVESHQKKQNIIGLVFPVYFTKPPRIVMNFIQKMPNADYVYAVATCGMIAGGVLNVLKNALLQRGITLSAGYIIPLTTNFVLLPNIKSEKGLDKAFKKAEAKTQDIAVNIKNRALRFDKNVIGILQKPFSVLVANPIYRRAPMLDKKFKVSSTCISCGACRDVCPVQNITLSGGKPVFHHQCEMCFSCINWCPRKAINWTAATKGHRRYRCRDISKDDVIAKRYFRVKKE